MTEVDTSRARRLKAATHGVHDGLDQTIMKAEPFASRESYADFLRVQQLFHRDIAALYGAPELATKIPDLADRRRYEQVCADLADLGAAPAPEGERLRFEPDAPLDAPTALGWLYVAEGSNLGAAFLLKAAAGLGLSAEFGARHLAASPEGRANHWRSFTAALDALDLTVDEEARVMAGASAAFSRVRGLVDRTFWPGTAAA
ncbi:biliverdin-producing heme oxygenase [Brevundimonas sp. SL130]|uniref:biliverdin-producing heme oxygenase n=1 Tax=Brevundimonas sp. SL130 TaxID=2995143 RepID=UPI00226D1230|nr:biliverdin-producing heme oxygenase [Brevundimonas sp. SL130]WAC61253.1 biliverdin-producing heme oxygenase [Brevundimonas sp. SL130]